MAVALDHLAKTLLDAPVGHVEQTIEEILEKPVRLDVIEQNLISGTEYNRKIVIAFGKVPIVSATVRFDSKNIPKLIMTELLQKKEGIGNILRKHNITVQRNTLEINVESDGKKLMRSYEIWHNNLIWFDIIEEIRLDLLNTCQNR
ncbi:MAG TPA: hypothetical protein VD699_04355 [Nitrosopumilaceae archaeon]|nr:hypothetical protein [Nitrosopumilaceae archaeon]HXV38784.1 hypothetical protein [Nitrosopumilaceae archaeon]